MYVSRSTHHFGPNGNISTPIQWIAMKFGTDIYGAQRMNPSYFGNPPSFSSSATSGLKFSLIL